MTELTNEEISLRTKEQLSAALKDEMRRKPLSKVTVSSLIAKCNINRNTFYYHFADVYDLLKWTLEREAIDLLKKIDLLVNTEDAINFILDYVDSNKHILNCAYDSVSHERVKEFFYTEMTAVIEGTIEEAEAELGVRLEKEYRSFVTRFFTEALSGMLTSYVSGQIKLPREEIVPNLISIGRTSLTAMLREKGIPVNL